MAKRTIAAPSQGRGPPLEDAFLPGEAGVERAARNLAAYWGAITASVRPARISAFFPSDATIA